MNREYVTQPACPGHVAIIMDGNGRWATSRGQSRSVGHAEGAKAATRAYRAARALGVRQLTLYGFSTANFKRPAHEVDVIMHLVAQYAHDQREDFINRGIRFDIVGDREQLPKATRDSLEATIAATADQEGMVLSLALAYGGRLDVMSAVRVLIRDVQSGLLNESALDEQALRRRMWTGRLPDVDLLVRTGGEQRLSDFLLVENAYSELFFDDVMWPDFDHEALARAVGWFAQRQRRFGDVTAVGQAA